MQVENVHSVDMRAYCWRKRVQGLKNHVEPDFTLFSQVGKLVAQQLVWLKPTMHKNVNLFHSNEMNLLIADGTNEFYIS